jgi:hypothetical protein
VITNTLLLDNLEPKNFNASLRGKDDPNIELLMKYDDSVENTTN